jgi:predicted ATPase/serine/threonine protein kinase/DNA-binding SARP family transcriptional activator
MSSESARARPVGPASWSGLSASERERLAAVLAAYELGEPLGRGACGLVLAARHRGLGRDVAIKVLSTPGELLQDARERFVGEARVLASLDHPHVVPIYDFVEADGLCLLIMERMDGGTVKTCQGAAGWTAPAACGVLLATCAALEHAHARGVLHRDIKPANLLISGDGVVKVADFGIAKLMSDATAVLTRTGTVLGTPAYMAPELIQGAPPAPAIDVYAAGTVLYELLCGSLPFPPRPDAMAQLYQRVNEDPIPLHRRAPSLPAALGAVTARALQRDPAQRYATAGELAAAVTQAARSAWGEQWLQASGVSVKTAVATVTPTEPPPTPPRFRILGPIEVSDEQGRLLSLGGLKQRAVLVALLLCANRVLTADALVDELWGEDPPPQATNALQTYISKLRGALEPDRKPREPARVLRSQPPGYMLIVNPADFDAALVEELCGEGRALLKHGRADAARERFADALALWRGPALAEFADQPRARAEAARLEDLRALALEDRIAADLALGEHAAVIGELQRSVVEQPLRERLWEHLIVALYRAGRQGDALAAYQRCRMILDEELGVEPGPTLKRLHSEVLEQDSALDGDAAPPQEEVEQSVAAHPAEVHPAPSPRPPATNLPAQRTALIGRSIELTEICDLLRRPQVAIVTLTGTGGVGKTRLAMQAGTQLLAEFADGVFFVSLAALSDAQLVIPTIAQTLGVIQGFQTLASSLAQKRMLLVLDNMEQLLSAGPALGELLGEAPEVKLLVTSREALRLRAECCYRVRPLELADPATIADTGEALRHGALELFAERARAVQSTFEVTHHNAATIAEICARLDGLPLAIELAAARTAVLTPHAILARITKRFSLLAGGPVDLPERHQTLRSTIAWSYDLLRDDQQRLFARLAVFSGGFTLDAAEAVCDADLDDVASLVDKSLVRADGERFGLFESIREFALEQLADDLRMIRKRHADYYLELAETAHPQRWREERALAARLQHEHDNFRAALTWLQDADAHRHAALTSALGWLWHVHGHFDEGRDHLRRALQAGPRDGVIRARLLTAAGELGGWSGEGAAATALLERAVELWDGLGQDQEVVFALQDLGWAHFFGGAEQQARSSMERSLRLQRQIGDDYLVNRAQVLVLQTLISLGEVDIVERLGVETLALATQLGDRRSVQHTQHFLADCPLIRGDCAAAQQRYLEALKTAIEIGDRIKMTAEVQGLGMAAAGLSDARRALLLCGGAAAELDVLGVDLSMMRFWIALLDRHLAAARAQLGPAEAAKAWQEGRQMQFADVMQYALDVAAD